MSSEVSQISGAAYCQVTSDIRVSVVPEHLAENSDPRGNIFAFAYTVKIENLGCEKVQLIERHWVILSAGQQVAEVIGPGVVGEQPELNPGQTFEYTSAVVIYDPYGSMRGSYTLRSESGKYFQAVIPQFELLYSPMIH